MIKTFEDACKITGDNSKDFESGTTDEIAYRKLKVICRALNEGWEPDWDNTNEYKYYPYFNMQSGFSLIVVIGTNASTDTPGRLVFKTEAVAQYAVTQFLELYKQFYKKQ